MPLLSKVDLLNIMANAVNVSGWNILYLTRIDEHPFRLQIYREDENYTVRVYIWNLTHGGGKARPENEYRIQITGLDHFEEMQSEKTLVLGWWVEAEVFAGFDVRKHRGNLGRSPSFQVRKECLQQAAL